MKRKEIEGKGGKIHEQEDPLSISPSSTLSLYVHWPWCLRKCPYCDFNSHVAATIPEEAYVETLIADLRAQQALQTPQPLHSIFLGGGTPSLMRPASVGRILNEARSLFSFEEGIEITLEANPTSSTAEKFQAFAAEGVNRFSVGVQSLRDEDLRFLGREHSAAEAVAAIESALKAVPNVSLDLIYGLPTQTVEQWGSVLRQALAIGTPHLSAYQLTIEPNTAFYSQVRRHMWTPVPDDAQADFFEETYNILVAEGYEGYELSNFAKDGYKCKHNLAVWRYGAYMGIGAGAHGRLTLADKSAPKYATQHAKQPSRYMEDVKCAHTNNHPFHALTELEPTDTILEKVLMGLRLEEGVSLTMAEADSLNRAHFTSLQQEEFLSYRNERLRLTNKGRLFMDAILRKLFS